MLALYILACFAATVLCVRDTCPDGTLSYFHNVHQQQQGDDTELEYERLLNKKPEMYRARYGDLPWSPKAPSLKAAELMATKAYLQYKVDADEVKTAERYLCSCEKEASPSVRNLSFGEKVEESESQTVEYKANRPGSPNDHPPLQPTTFKALKSSVETHLTKYACAFLNSHLLHSRAIRQTSTIVFGIHDDRTIDAYFTTEKNRDELEQQIHIMLRTVHGEFEYDIKWQQVEVMQSMETAYILKISFTPSFGRKQVFAVDTGYNKPPAFWIRKGPMVLAMQYEEIKIAFSRINNFY